ncbi:family 43 glycosylhydrolase [Actinoplanes sp. TFC3]|uniref:family 43 glycosylhydrolase n=1 Tax=Actinoplanes sp. TFC3 TaxID=1710355 RepID=UPI000836C769|nr:family 43 glycosylhydrolase [Actinoplanes sp. TFC3]
MRKTPVLLSLLLSITGLGAIAPTSPVAAAVRAATYTNPVSAGTVDTFPDPATIKAKDGKWYAYGTTNPIFNSKGETGEHILPILSSADLVHWTYEGDVFALNAKPSWWPAAARQWAPDIRYFNNEYHLTYAQSTGGIALVTSPNPNGPWTDRGLIVPNGSGCPSGTIDQAMFQDTDGSYYLYWGSYDTICAARMNDNATAITGAVTTIARGRRMEGGFVVHRGGYYYLFYSDGGCCDGAFSGYVTKVGRATSPTGPFTSPGGLNLMDTTSKDGIVVAANGNGWAGPGHNAFTTDLAGQDWLVYHAISEKDPDFPPVTGANGATLNLTRRPLLIDRLDWINGWPVVNAGAGPSAGAQTAPVTTWTVGSTFESSAGFGTNWPLVDGHLSTTTASTVLSNASIGGDVRVEGDVRGTSAGIVASYQSASKQIAAWLDSSTKRFVVSVGGAQTSAPLPANFNYNSWHTIALEKRGTSLYAEVSAARLRDAVATVSVAVPASFGGGRIGAVSKSGAADVDNLGAAPLYQPVTKRVADPAVGVLLPAYSDEFTGTSLGAGWSWVRGNPGATVSGGSLVWPTQQAELYLGDNSASVLTRDVPANDFVVETKLTFDGTRGNQQAGLLLYENDDRFVKLVHSVLPLTTYGPAAVQQTIEFTKEHTRVSTGQTFSGPMFGGPARATTWLRLAYHYDAANNANDVRMASSTDGKTWEWGGAWSFPRGGPLKIGLVSMNTSGATGTFDYVRTYGH